MKNILITAVGNLGVGSQIVESLRISSDARLYLVGTDIKDDHIGCLERLDSFYCVPSPSEDQYFNRINEIIDIHNIELIFVCSIKEAYWFYKNMNYFLQKGIYVILDKEELFHLCMDKCALFDYLKINGIPLPKYKRISCIEDCEAVDFFPVVLKQNNQAIASNHVYIAYDIDDLKLLSQYLIKNNIPIIAQEWVGDDTNEYSISVTCNTNGEIIGSIAMLRSFDSSISYKCKIIRNDICYVISSGITQGTIVRNPDLCKQAETISEVLGSHGSLNLQGKWVNGIFWLIDAHPAITSSVYLKALAGYNEPLLIVNQYLYGKSIDLTYKEMKITRKFTVITEEIEHES